MKIRFITFLILASNLTNLMKPAMAETLQVTKRVVQVTCPSKASFQNEYFINYEPTKYLFYIEKRQDQVCLNSIITHGSCETSKEKVFPLISQDGEQGQTQGEQRQCQSPSTYTPNRCYKDLLTLYENEFSLRFRPDQVHSEERDHTFYKCSFKLSTLHFYQQ